MSRVFQSVSDRTLTFDDGSTLEVPASVFLKIDGHGAVLSELRPGDVIEEHNGEDGKLAVLKVVRSAELPTSAAGSGSTSSSSAATDGGKASEESAGSGTDELPAELADEE